jgi:rhodanese-related sulfurtransferase
MNVSIKTIMAEDLLQEMEEAEAHEDLPITVINVLPPADYADCHIKDSMNIPLEKLPEVVEDWDRDRKIVVYCASQDCPKSREAYLLLERMGFSEIRAFEDGIKGWGDLSYPTEGLCQKKH